MADFIQITLGGLTLAAVYLLVGIGWNLVYNASGYLNVAIGEFYILGALLTFKLEQSAGLPPLVAGAVAIALTGVIGWACERFLIRPLGRAGFHALIVTIGIDLLLFQGARALVPTDIVRPETLIDARPIAIGGVLVQPNAVLVWVTAIVLTGALFWFFQRTDTGRVMRACADNRDGAIGLGLDVAAFGTLAFTASAVLAATAGFVISPTQGVSFSSGIFIAIKSFVAISIFGIGRYGGAAAGAVMVALAEVYIARYGSADLRDALVLGAFLVVLYVRTAKASAGTSRRAAARVRRALTARPPSELGTEPSTP